MYDVVCWFVYVCTLRVRVCMMRMSSLYVLYDVDVCKCVCVWFVCDVDMCAHDVRVCLCMRL